jgi:hypothetical protein
MRLMFLQSTSEFLKPMPSIKAELGGAVIKVKIGACFSSERITLTSHNNSFLLFDNKST